MKSQLFNKILIIQSLGKQDAKTGRFISDDVAILAAVHSDNITVEFEHVNTKQELFELIETQIEGALSKGIYPILHFEMHGFKEGIALINGEEVLFEELKPFFTRLNHATKFNLFVIFGACHAIHMINIIKTTSPSPVWGILAPVEKIDAQSLVRDFPEFYKELIENGNVLNATKKLVPAHSLNDSPFYFTSAEQLFADSIRRYKNDKHSAQNLRVLAYRIDNILTAKGVAVDITELTEFIKEDLLEVNVINMESFFMLKDYPENFHRLMFSDLYLDKS